MSSLDEEVANGEVKMVDCRLGKQKVQRAIKIRLTKRRGRKEVEEGGSAKFRDRVDNELDGRS